MIIVPPQLIVPFIVFTTILIPLHPLPQVIIPSIVFGAIVIFLSLRGPSHGSLGAWTAVAFVIGSVTSLAAGWIGMRIAVYANVRTAHQCWYSLERGFQCALLSGSFDSAGARAILSSWLWSERGSVWFPAESSPSVMASTVASASGSIVTGTATASAAAARSVRNLWLQRA